MPVAGTITPRVALIVNCLRTEGVRNTDLAARFSVTVGAIRDIRRRYGIASAPVGRPPLVGALSADQQALVREHMKYARGVARRCLRDYSRMPSFDEGDYISSAYLGLVKAASRWQGRGSFKALCAKWVEGGIRDFRRADMLAHGWAWETSDHRKMIQSARIASWPRRQCRAVMAQDGSSSTQMLAEAFGAASSVADEDIAVPAS